MKCSKCRHENRTGAKFCEECAAPLACVCPNCGSQVSAAAKFCPECAHPLLAPATEPRFTSPGSYTPKSIQIAGFEAANREDLDQAATELEKLGHPFHIGTPAEANSRMVRDFISFTDPTGNRIEIAWRPAVSGTRYHGTRDAGITGFSHIGLCTTDPVRDEASWTQVCNARVSDRIGDAALLRIDEVHHSIALFPTDRAGIQHINHQVETGDDIMRSLHFLNERRVRITFEPGRHPSSSAKFLYFEGPDGMVFEYSSGVRSIADELLYRERQLRSDPKGFCQWGAKPQIREFM